MKIEPFLKPFIVIETYIVIYVHEGLCVVNKMIYDTYDAAFNQLKNLKDTSSEKDCFFGKVFKVSLDEDDFK